VWEETGFDVMPWIQEEHYVEQYMKDQRIRLYVIKGVPEDTVFVPQTRKEISKIEWHNVSDLPSSKAKPVDRGAQSGKESGSEVPNPKHPSRYFMVIPFVHKLKAWIAAQRKLAKRKGPQQNRQPAQHTQTSPGTTSRQEQPLSAQAGSDILKSMLGINGSPGSQRVEPHQSPSQQQQPSLVSHQPVSPPNNSQEPRPDLSKSSESLRELLGIGGMVEPSLSGQPPSSSSSSSSAAPLPGPSSGNSSDTLKALLGIPLGLPAPTSGSSPSSSPVHVLNPTLVHPLPPHLPHHYPHPHHAGHDSPRFQAAQPARMGYSPQLHHATATHMHHVSAPNSPHLTRAGAISTVSTPAHSTPGGGGGVGARKSSVDLLALLNSGGGGGGQPNGHHHAPQHPHPYHQHHQHQHPQQPFFPPMMNGFMPGPNGHAYPMNGGHHSNHGSPVLARQEPRYYHQQLPPQHQRTMSYPSPKMGYVSSPNLPSATPAAAAQSDHSGQGHGAKANKQQQQQQQSNGSNRSKGNTMRDFQFNMDGIV
ncbi:mRNA-decapping enzyme subunit 2, partial [Actinomortierella ambigua]